MSNNDVVISDSILYPDIKQTSKSTKVLDTYKNLAFLLKHFKADIRYNLMSRNKEISIPSYDVTPHTDLNSVISIVERLSLMNEMPATGKIPNHLDFIALQHAYHPIVEMIKNNKWDGFKRLDTFINTIKTTNDNFSYKLIRTWMVAAIAAAHSQTGFINQGVLVLQGSQGIGKTRFVKSLDPLNCNAVKEGYILDPANKDSVIGASRHWILELGELDATFRKSDIARLKGFITQECDDIRLPYARVETKLPRKSVYIATVNEENFLADDTGNRRWWTVSVQSINLNHGLDLKQVWAEVYHYWINGDKTYLSNDLEKELNIINKEHEKIDPLEELILSKYDWLSPGRRNLTATDVLIEFGYTKPTKAESTKMGAIIKSITGKKANRRFHEVPYLMYTSKEKI